MKHADLLLQTYDIRPPNICGMLGAASNVSVTYAAWVCRSCCARAGDAASVEEHGRPQAAPREAVQGIPAACRPARLPRARGPAGRPALTRRGRGGLEPRSPHHRCALLCALDGINIARALRVVAIGGMFAALGQGPARSLAFAVLARHQGVQMTCGGPEECWGRVCWAGKAPRWCASYGFTPLLAGGMSVCVVLHVAVFTGTSVKQPVSPCNSSCHIMKWVGQQSSGGLTGLAAPWFSREGFVCSAQCQEKCSATQRWSSTCETSIGKWNRPEHGRLGAAQ
jgi:hypothetical protein